MSLSLSENLFWMWPIPWRFSSVVHTPLSSGPPLPPNSLGDLRTSVSDYKWTLLMTNCDLRFYKKIYNPKHKTLTPEEWFHSGLNFDFPFPLLIPQLQPFIHNIHSLWTSWQLWAYLTEYNAMIQLITFWRTSLYMSTYVFPVAKTKLFNCIKKMQFFSSRPTTTPQAHANGTRIL